MKLPLLTAVLTSLVALQSPVASADIIRPERGPEERRDERRDDRRGGHRDRDDRWDRDDRRGGPVRPDRPPVRPNPRPDPYPSPNPRPPSHPPSYPPTYPDRPTYPPGHYQGEASVQFYGVTRRFGGEWLRVQFRYASYVDYVYVTPYRAGLRIHEAYAITQSGRRIHLGRLTYGGTIYSGIMSDYVMAGERIVAIDIRAESMGGNTDVDVRVISGEGVPSIYPVRY